MSTSKLHALARPAVFVCVAAVFLSAMAPVSAGPNGPTKLFQESSSQDDAKSLNPIKTLITDSGELSLMSKRRSGFLPMRGKKDLFFEGASVEPNIDESARAAFLSEAAKRASGFLPMRGRKSSADATEDFEEMMEKRRVASFMPMRGRKWDNAMPLGQPESAVPSTANAWYPRFYHPVPLGAGPYAAAGQPGPLMYYPVKTDSASYFNEEQPAMEAIEKRKSMGFLGARGKRSALM